MRVKWESQLKTTPPLKNKYDEMFWSLCKCIIDDFCDKRKYSNAVNLHKKAFAQLEKPPRNRHGEVMYRCPWLIKLLLEQDETQHALEALKFTEELMLTEPNRGFYGYDFPKLLSNFMSLGFIALKRGHHGMAARLFKQTLRIPHSRHEYYEPANATRYLKPEILALLLLFARKKTSSKEWTDLLSKYLKDGAGKNLSPRKQLSFLLAMHEMIPVQEELLHSYVQKTLLAATQAGNLELVKTLLKHHHSASIREKDKNGSTVFLQTIFYCQPLVLKFFLERELLAWKKIQNDSNSDSWMPWFKGNTLKILNSFQEPLIQQKNANQDTPLILAALAYRNPKEMLTLLLKFSLNFDEPPNLDHMNNNEKNARHLITKKFPSLIYFEHPKIRLFYGAFFQAQGACRNHGLPLDIGNKILKLHFKL